MEMQIDAAKREETYVCVVVYWREIHPGNLGYEPGMYKKNTVFHIRHEPFTAKRLAVYDSATEYFVTQQRKNETLEDTKLRALKALEPSEISDVVDGISP